LFKDVAMAVRFILGAVAEQSDGLSLGQIFEQTQGKFLPVILDCAIASVDRVTFKKLRPVTAAELRPPDLSRLKVAQEFLARPEIRHPDVVTVLWQAAAPETGGKDAKAIPFGLN
jgi:hypothetical protein